MNISIPAVVTYKNMNITITGELSADVVYEGHHYCVTGNNYDQVLAVYFDDINYDEEVPADGTRVVIQDIVVNNIFRAEDTDSPAEALEDTYDAVKRMIMKLNRIHKYEKLFAEMK